MMLLLRPCVGSSPRPLLSTPVTVTVCGAPFVTVVLQSHDTSGGSNRAASGKSISVGLAFTREL